MDGIPPALKSDLEDVAWALETAESLWKRGERVDAVVWVRRAAQAAGEGEDAKRAASLARYAAELGDYIASHTMAGDAIDPFAPGAASEKSQASQGSIEAVDALLGATSMTREESDAFVLSTNDVEFVSARDFEAGFGVAPSKPPARSSGAPQAPSDGDVMTVSIHAPDLEIIEQEVSEDEFDDEPTPVVQHPRSPVPDAPVPSAAQAHAGMLDPWTDAAAKRPPAKSKPSSDEIAPASEGFDDEEVITSAKRNAAQAPAVVAEADAIPRAPKAPRFPPPRGRPAPEPVPDEPDTTTYRQINPRAPRAEAPAAPKAAPKGGPLARPPRPPTPPPPPRPPTAPPAPKTAPAPVETRPREATPRPPAVPSAPPALDLLEMVDSVTLPEERPRSIPASARPTGPPPNSIPLQDSPDAKPSGAPTRPHAGQTLLDLGAVEALTDLPDDAREAFGAAATIHTIARDEEVSHFALALVVEGEIDVSATIVDAAALRLERNAILRSRGTIVPGVGLRLVCASDKALIATWDDAAVEAAFRTCPWVEDDLRAVADRVQAKAGVTMGPLGERFDQSLREQMLGRLTVRSLAPGEVLVAQGKPMPIAVVGVGELVVTKDGARVETLRSGDIVFPTQTLAHAPAPSTAAAGPGGAVVLYGEHAVAQELLMTFPPLLELFATI